MDQTEPQKELKFIHISKTGGSSIMDIGKKHSLDWTSNFKTSRTIPQPVAKVYAVKHHYGHILPKFVEESVRSKYDWFMVVRNPYTRIVSEYHYMMPKSVQRGFIQNSDLLKDKAYFNTFLRDYIEYTRHNLEGFEYFMQNKDQLPSIHTFWGRPFGGFCTPQHLYLDSSVKQHILKFETLKDDFDALMKQYNLPIELDMHINKAPVSFFSVSDLDSATIALINEFYAKDFEAFGYEMINPPPPPSDQE